MACTTILAGKLATNDGSTFMARNEDAPDRQFNPKKFIVVNPDDQPRAYESVISHCKVALPDNPLRYTAVPNAINNEGIWGEAGINAANVAMSETETITSNPRVLSADPLVKEGLGEEDFLTVVLPYIHSAREGVERMGALLEEYGTYEMNGIGFQDTDNVWWFETIGGHHWIARRVPDDCYVVMPNQQGIDYFDFTDAFGDQNDFMCSEDLISFIEDNDLDVMMLEEDCPLAEETAFDVRGAFGSHDDSDKTYNTPRAWYMLRCLNPTSFEFDGPHADFRPTDQNLPWCMVPERKLTAEDVKYVLSAYYQNTPFDPYLQEGMGRSVFRPIGINRNNFMALTTIRPNVDEGYAGVQWMCMGSNPFNAQVPFYTNVSVTPAYYANTDDTVTTNNIYWTNRLVAAMADSHKKDCASIIERYQNAVHIEARRLLKESDAGAKDLEGEALQAHLEQANQAMSDMMEDKTNKLLADVLYTCSTLMKNGFGRSDA